MKLRFRSDGGCVNNRLKMNYMRLTHIRISSCIRITRCTTMLEERNIYPRLTDSCFGCYKATSIHILFPVLYPRSKGAGPCRPNGQISRSLLICPTARCPQCFLHICQHDCTRTEAPYPSFEVIRAVCIIPILNICTALTNVT